jgi:putative PIN family toxin of toxin-antitoxin system
MSDGTRVVFDCNTFVQALGAPDGPAGRCVQLAFDGRIQLFISPAVIDELREVTRRPSVIAKLGLVSERVDDFIEAVEVAATLLDGFAETFRYERDPDDAHYVNLALAADAKLIVSRDKDLLELMDVSKPGARDFQLRFPTLRILDPVTFLREFAPRP